MLFCTRFLHYSPTSTTFSTKLSPALLRYIHHTCYIQHAYIPLNIPYQSAERWGTPFLRCCSCEEETQNTLSGVDGASAKELKGDAAIRAGGVREPLLLFFIPGIMTLFSSSPSLPLDLPPTSPSGNSEPSQNCGNPWTRFRQFPEVLIISLSTEPRSSSGKPSIVTHAPVVAPQTTRGWRLTESSPSSAAVCLHSMEQKR